ncbi:MAG: hypothetical protein WDN45_00485 [Caulobacteraceae bacterium]
MESRTAIPALTAWLEAELGVVFLNQTVAFEAAPPRLQHLARPGRGGRGGGLSGR